MLANHRHFFITLHWPRRGAASSSLKNNFINIYLKVRLCALGDKTLPRFAVRKTVWNLAEIDMYPKIFIKLNLNISDSADVQ
jgi:hypothetical protein